jgi:hypothetical protein
MSGTSCRDGEARRPVAKARRSWCSRR